ncbi:jg6714 [Pararge aegeria aegeria]|uniref:Jg6714 protein n=2 Tax=Pararge aegeria TaxID=116150 RepID=A0A8S4SK13_9NEOP|nr:jg6714 [Pararge aegeria aegeria]
MSDTDEELVPNSFQKYPHDKIAVHTQLSNANKTTYGSYNSMMTHYNMQNQFMGLDQRSMYPRRATSPMSVCSFPNTRMQLQQSYSQSAMSSRGSVYNARCRSPMSVRSIDSNASVSAADIALAFKNIKFNKYDLRIIQDAYNTHMKNRMRRRIGKRRNLKSFIKHCRRNSGGESGAEGSNSSISSDDCRSTRSAFYTNNLSRARSRPTKMDFNKITTQVRENHIYKDCTENFKTNSLRNLFPAHDRIVNRGIMPYCNQQSVSYDHRYTEVPQHNDQCKKLQNEPIVTLKDRLAKDASSLLPFQRFNKSGVNPTYEISYTEKKKTVQQTVQIEVANNKRYDETDIESDDIFPQSISCINLTQSNSLQQKKVLETESNYPERKRRKLSTSPTNQINGPTSRKIKKNITKVDEFKFKKPQLPMKKTGLVIKSNEPEILIAKSSQPLVGNLEPIKWKEMPQKIINVEDKEDTSNLEKQASQTQNDTMNNKTVTDISHNSTDVSMKPSLMKRKLFTQKLDIVENKNIISDNINSPQTKVLRACREKNKVRKLTSQSCLSRDVHGDDNFLDLLHKIVPPDQIKNQNLNNTNVANNKRASKRSLEQNSKWDVTLAVSTCNDDDKSATYTDEEIFNDPQGTKKLKEQQINKAQIGTEFNSDDLQKKKNGVTLKCKVVAQTLPDTFNSMNYNAELREKQCQDKRTVMNCVKSFWDTDFESDMDDRISYTSKRTFENDKIPRDFIQGNDVIVTKMKPRGTLLSVRNSRNLSINQSAKSNVSQNPKVKSHKDNLNENKENNNDINELNRSTRSRSKNKEAEMHHSKDKKSVNNKLKENQTKQQITKNLKSSKQEKLKPKPPSSTKKKDSQSIFNISRESLRPKNKSNTSISPPKTNRNIKSVSNNCNTSRESIRLKQKREAKINCKNNVSKNKKK